jgi:hypothetical protein
MAPGRVQCHRPTCPGTSRRAPEGAYGSPLLSARQISPRCLQQAHRYHVSSCAVNGNTDARFMRRRKTTAPVSSRPAKLQSFAEVDAKHDNPHGSAPSRSGNQNRCLPIPAESGRAIR